MTATLGVHLMENHDQAWHVWREAGIEDRVLVHVDAHHDMWWIDDARSVTIANFICPALREGLLRRVYWIVPDGTMQTSAARHAVLSQVKSVATGYKADFRSIEATPAAITVSLAGRTLTVCTIDSLNAIDEPVLLDIDVDYFVIPRVAHGCADTHADRPWRWPAELVEKIAAVPLRADLATVAYSVEGCYTPLGWKYLGEELAARLRTPEDARTLAGFALMRGAVEAAEYGNLDVAEDKYVEAATLLPQSAAPYYHLALLAARRGNTDESRRHHRRVLDLDPTYGTGFNNLGPHYFWQHQYARAAAEYERTLLLNPGDGYACIGMARLAAQRKRWSEAIVWFSKASAISDEILDAHRGLGEAYARTGDLEKAAKHFERSLQLALHGHKPLSWHILTATRPEQLMDEDHCDGYLQLGRVHVGRGQRQKAIDCYQIALAAGDPGVRVRLEAARLLAGAKRWPEALRQLASAGGQIPKSARRHARRIWRACVSSVRALNPQAAG